MRVLVRMAVAQIVRDLAVAAAVAGQAAVGGAGLQVGDALLQQLEDFLLKPEVRRAGEADPRILRAQVLDLAVDALHQRAGVEVVGQHDDLAHADQRLALHHPLQPREGDAGEGQVDQLVVARLLQPARHLGHVAVGGAVGGAAPQQDHAGGRRVRHVERIHGPAQPALEDRQDRIAGGEVRAVEECGAGAVRAGVLDRLRNLHLDVAGGVEDQRQHQHAARALRRGDQAVVQRGRRELDEADLDAPAWLARTPLRDELADLDIAGFLARAVADEQDAVWVGIHAEALRKRWVKPGS